MSEDPFSHDAAHLAQYFTDLSTDRVATDQYEIYIVSCFIDVSADSVALRSDCTDAQADLELYCPHMVEDWCLKG